MTDPRTVTGGPGNAGLAVWLPKMGEDFWKKFAAQNPILYVNYQLVIDAVVHGDKPVAVWPAFSSTTTAIRAGAPIKIIHLKEGTPYPLQGIAFVKNAPHPNASMVLLNWLFTKEGQQATAKALDSFSVRNDVTEDWLLPDLNPKNFIVLEPPTSFLSDDDRQKAADFAKKYLVAK